MWPRGLARRTVTGVRTRSEIVPPSSLAEMINRRAGPVKTVAADAHDNRGPRRGDRGRDRQRAGRAGRRCSVGAIAWGGVEDGQLSDRLRVASAVATLVLIGMALALVLLTRGGLVFAPATALLTALAAYLPYAAWMRGRDQALREARRRRAKRRTAAGTRDCGHVHRRSRPLLQRDHARSAPYE